jgi:hypothetical protein
MYDICLYAFVFMSINACFAKKKIIWLSYIYIKIIFTENWKSYPEKYGTAFCFHGN